MDNLKGSIKAFNVYHTDAYMIAVKHGFEGTEAEWLKSLELSPEEVDQAVANYLDEHPAGIDKTLTVSGEAADAKVTGDAIKNITAEKLGAYNLTTFGVRIPEGADLNDYTTPGIYSSASTNITATLVNASPNTAGFKLIVEQNASTKGLVQTVLPTGATNTFCFRTSNGTTWTPWRKIYDTNNKPTAAEVGATPASHATETNNPHGVTLEQLAVDTIDSCTGDELLDHIRNLANGMPTNSVKHVFVQHIEPVNGWFLDGALMTISKGLGSPTLFELERVIVSIVDYHGYRLQFGGYILSGEWNADPEFSWENPPMKPGVEYRTTEYHNDKPVYAYYANFGSLPAEGEMSFNIGASETAIEDVVSFEVFAYGDSNRRYKFPFISAANGEVYAIARTSGNRTVLVHAFHNISAYTGHAIIKYTKK